MKRREFITLISSAAASWPIAVRAQQRNVPVVGFLSSRSSEGSSHLVQAFLAGLAEAGYVKD